MPDQPAATLRDVTTQPSPNPPAATPAEPAKAPAPEADAAKAAAAAATQVSDAEALEIGRVLRDSGVTKDQVNDLLQAPGALESLRSLITGNPQEFYDLLQRTNPDAEGKMLEAAADRYVKRYGKEDDAGDGKKGADGTGANSELMQEVKALREKVNAAETREQQRQAAAAMAQVKARYEGRVDDLFAQLPKDVGLTKAETRALRAQLNQELAGDPDAVQRVSNGNFVDVPRRFQSIIEGWAADKKAASEAAKSQRERTSAISFNELSGGPVELPKEFTEPGADIWDEAPLARALQGAAGK